MCGVGDSQENTAGALGGAVSVSGGNLTLSRSLVAANRAARGYPAVHIQPGAGARVDQDAACVFRDNWSPRPPPGPALPYPTYTGLTGTLPPR